MKVRIIIVIFLGMTCSVLVHSQTLPTLPTATVDITMPTQAGTVRNVTSGSAADFAAKITAATCGDTIVLVAGSTYTGNFVIPNKVCSGWILIQSSALTSLPASNNRVGPSNTANMAKVTSNTAGVAAITFQASAHNWRLIGLELTATVGLQEYSLVETDVSATSTPQFPNHIIVDRCYFHGSFTSSVRRGIDLLGDYMAVVDSYFSEIHDQVSMSDSQAVATWCANGPLLLQNNFLSAAGENFMSGGASCGIVGVEPADITVVGNWFWKDYANWQGAGFIIKNLFELKKANRVLIDGNVFDYSWAEAQSGTAIVITPRSDSCPTCGIADVTFTHNLIRHASEGLRSSGSDDSTLSASLNRMLVSNNVFTDISSSYLGNGWGLFSKTDSGFAGGSSQNNVTIDHNSVFADQVLLYLGDSGHIPSYRMTNNIGTYGTNGGIFGGGVGAGSIALSTYITSVNYNDFVMLNATGNPDGGTWPSGTFWNTTAGALFTNYAAANYQLQAGSAYHNAGTDGKDIGVWDWVTFNRETTNALNGTFAALGTTFTPGMKATAGTSMK